MLLFVVSMTALTSCNKEAQNLIVGKWECVNAFYTDEGITYPIPNVDGMIWEFKSDGKLTVTLPASIDHEIDLYNPTASYVILGDLLTITSTDEDGDVDTEVYNIKELNDTKLLLENYDGDVLVTSEFKRK